MGEKIHDYSDHVNPLSFSGSPTWGGGPGGPVIVFDPSTLDYIDIGPMADLVGLSQVTIGIQYKRKGTPGPEFLRTQIGQWNGSVGWMIFQSGAANQKLTVLVGGGTAQGGLNVFPSMEEHIIFLVFDGTLSGNANRLKLYLDGVLQTLNFSSGTVPAAWPDATASNARIGSLSAALPRHFQGDMGSVVFWDRALLLPETRELTFLDTWSRYRRTIYPPMIPSPTVNAGGLLNAGLLYGNNRRLLT